MIIELYLDTSDVVAVKTLSRIFPLAGMTTSPGIIAAGKEPLEAVLPQLHRAMGGQGRLFAQVMATTVERMMNDACKLRFVIADIMVKIPVTTKGLAAIKVLKPKGTPTLGTAVYGAAQGLLSTLADARYIAPYIDRIGAQGGSGIQTVTNLHQLLKMRTPQAKVLVASFGTPHQALDYLLARCESTILPLDVARQMISYPTVDTAVTKLEQDWLGAFDRTSI